MPRLRVKFSRGDEVRFISHLDLIRAWQRALRRAGIPLAYSEGFNPHPKMSLAAPLAVGITSEAELMDIHCQHDISPHNFMAALGAQLPPGLSITRVIVVSPLLPSLQSLVQAAEYQVTVKTIRGETEVKEAIAQLLGRTELPWQHERDTGIRQYDLRTLVDDIWFIGLEAGRLTLGMRLFCDNRGSGRPEQVARALGCDEYPDRILRARLILKSE
jgi:radical SAM-linked protein